MKTQYEGKGIKDHAFLTSYYMEVNSQFDNLVVLPLRKEPPVSTG
jgi:hypothetical protein